MSSIKSLCGVLLAVVAEEDPPAAVAGLDPGHGAPARSNLVAVLVHAGVMRT